MTTSNEEPLNYYNEWDPFAAAWLRNLIAAGLLPDGDVDERSIADVQPADLEGYTQHHFFAGIGGWPLALELAGWPSDAPVWTGSCPCQPFSNAGKGGGTSDPRHLWPQFHRLIAECRPPVVFGEQVASLDGRGWLAGVRADLESVGYAVGAADLCAASLGAPHIRSRLWWVADAHGSRPHPRRGNDGEERGIPKAQRQPEYGAAISGRSSPTHGVADAISETVRARPGGMGSKTPAQPSQGLQRQWAGSDAGHRSAGSGVDDADGERRNGESVRILERRSRQGRAEAPRPSAGSGVGNADESRSQGLNGADPAHKRTAWQTGAGFWDDAEFIPCLDGKSRRTQSGVSPLVDGFPGRVGQLRAYGNAISPQVAAGFVKAYLMGRYHGICENTL